MGKLHQTTIALVPFLFSLGVGCSSDSGGGGCQNLAGTYHAASTSCDSGGGDTKVVQTGCNATITTGQGDTVTGTVAGNKFTSPDVSCTVTISGASYITDCTQKDSTGKAVTCHDTGTLGDRPAAGGAGGAGTTGTGGSGNPGTGGVPNSSSGGTAGMGTGTPKCGVSWSEVASCDDCMTKSCCAELQNCGSGTPCGAFLDCVASNCTSTDANCIQTSCSAELKAATADVSTLSDCNTQKCQGCQ